jgi:hypothetical protein
MRRSFAAATIEERLSNNSNRNQLGRKCAKPCLCPEHNSLPMMTTIYTPIGIPFPFEIRAKLSHC